MTTHNEIKATPSEPIEVSAARLSSGIWCHESQQQLDKGDITAAYSADVIAFEGRVRTPFHCQGGLYVTVCTQGCGRVEKAEAYRLLTPDQFGEPTSTYNEKCRTDGARDDPNGFYHGMLIKHGKTEYVLCGPPQRFVASDEPVLQQGSLF